jgi:hypothetical protein
VYHSGPAARKSGSTGARSGMRKHRLVVKPHRPWKDAVLYGSVAVAVGSALWATFEYGRWRAGFDHVEAARAQARLVGELRDAERLNGALRDRVALLERSSEIDETARAQVQGSLSELQDQILELREELAFYRGIVSPEDAGTGLRIQSLKLTQGPQDRMYHYRLVLIQSIKHEQRATGSVELVVHGARAGQPVRLGLRELGEFGKTPLAYSFRYFQDFEGDLLLPDGFVPGRVEVALAPRGGGEAVRKSFDWSTIVG